MTLEGINNRIRYVDKNYDPYNISTEDFLKIYLKMLQLQDPTKPMEIKDMVQMNYQLQQIRFMTNLDNTFNSLIKNQQLDFITQAAFLIGKNAVLKTKEITNPSAHYVLVSPQDYSNVTVSIVDKISGKVVKEFSTDLKEGVNPLDTSDLPPGQYTVSVGKDGQNLTNVLLGIKEKVSYVSLVNNQPVLGTQNGEYPLTNVVYISS